MTDIFCVQIGERSHHNYHHFLHTIDFLPAVSHVLSVPHQKKTNANEHERVFFLTHTQLKWNLSILIHNYLCQWWEIGTSHLQCSSIITSMCTSYWFNDIMKKKKTKSCTHAESTLWVYFMIWLITLFFIHSEFAYRFVLYAQIECVVLCYFFRWFCVLHHHRFQIDLNLICAAQ